VTSTDCLEARINNNINEMETLALNHTFYVSDHCPLDLYPGVRPLLFFLTPPAATICGIVIALFIMGVKANGSTSRYYRTCIVLEQILAKTDLEERNEAFLEACVEYSKRQIGKQEPKFDREYGLGKSEEVYRHYIRMESKRLEENEKADQADGAKGFQEKTLLEGKIVHMV
jgi:hypothetical protein